MRAIRCVFADARHTLLLAKKAEFEPKGLIFELETYVDNDSMTTAFCNDPAGNRIQIVNRKKPLGS